VQMDKMESSKFEVEKFNGKTKFELWKLKMRDLQVQQGLQKALAGKSKKPTTIIEWEWEDLDEKSLSTIRLCLAYDVGKSIYDEVLDEHNLLEETVV
jgi:hypothetical protein